MDTGVAIVNAYLNVNGYFTVAEYPVLEAFSRAPARTVHRTWRAAWSPASRRDALRPSGTDGGVRSGVEGSAGGRWTTVPMRHVVEFLRNYLRDHWDVLRHAQIKDAGLGMLGLLEKCEQEGKHRTS